MSGIRALERADLPEVGALFELVMGMDPDPRLPGYFERILFGDPWADPDIPPLVHTSPAGEIVGFIGANTRRMRLDGRPIRMAVSSNLVAHPDWRSRGVGALLNRALLAGPQELTVADRAGPEARRLWMGLRGQEMVGASVGWYRILRPGSALGALLDVRERGGVLRAGARIGGPVDALARRLPKVGTALEPAEPAGTREPLTTELLLEQMSAAGRGLRLYPDYDAEFLRWVFTEIEALRGRLVARLVRGPQGRVLGWFLYLLPGGGTKRSGADARSAGHGGVAQVLQVGVPGTDPEPVIDHLFRQAHLDGAAVVHGRLEPALSGVADRPGVVLRKSARALVHSEDTALLGLLGTTKALLSHLDGEWAVSHARRQ